MPEETQLDTTDQREKQEIIDRIVAGTATDGDYRQYAKLVSKEAIAQGNLEQEIAENQIGDTVGILSEELQTDLSTRIPDQQTRQEIMNKANQPFFDVVKSQAMGTGNGSTDVDRPNQLKAADPVVAFSGEFTHEATDLQIDGSGISFAFRRFYRNQTIYSGPLGANWDHNYNLHLREVSPDELVLTTGELREQAYTRHPIQGYFVPPDGISAIFQVRGDSFQRRAPNGTLHIFRRVPATPDHELDRIEDRFGNFLQFSYQDGEKRLLASVQVNHPQRMVQFGYDSQDRLVTMTDYAEVPNRFGQRGRVWHYTYDDLNDLIAVTTPPTERYPAGLRTCYEYRTAFVGGLSEHNLSRIIDASGQLYLENEYGETPGQLNYNRVVRQRQGGGEGLFEYENIAPLIEEDYKEAQRPTHQTTLTMRNGHQVRHVYNKFGNLLFQEECVRLGGIPRTLVTRYRYNRDGQLVASLSPEGILTQYLFGRDLFMREHQITDEDTVATHPALTQQIRQEFGRLHVAVRRARTFDFLDLNLAQGVWGDFPDIFGAFEPGQDDIIIKYTYEPLFGQLLTVSHPRFTHSPLPGSQSESDPARYEATLTRYHYSGPTQLLTEVERPRPRLPDESLGPIIQEQFTDYDSRGRLLRSVNPVGVVAEHTYFDDPDELSLGHLRQTVIDPGGLNITTRFIVDALGRVTEIHLPKSVDAADGRFVTRTTYNELDQVIETTTSAPFNFQTRRFYDRNGKLEREEGDLRDETGQPELDGSAVATFCYDEEFNLVQSTVGGLDLAAHLVTKQCYDSAGNRNLTVLPNGNQMRTSYDERQLPVAQFSGAGSEDAATIRTEYDGDGRVRRTFDARGNSTTYDFDAFGRVIAEEDALGHIIRTNYDKASNVTCVRVFEKRDDGYFLLARSETEYDELNRAIRSGVNRFEDPMGPFQQPELDGVALNSPGPGDLVVTTTFYDAQSRVERTVDPLGRETQFQYDALDRVIRAIDPLGNETHSQYDAHSNLIRTDQIDRVLDENGVEVGQRIFASSSTYDELNRLTSRTDSLGNVTRFFYDSRGNVVRQVDPLGNEVRTAFDIFNRPVATTRFLTATGLGPVTSEAVPVTTAQEYDHNGNLTAVIDALGRRTRYLYDALDRRRAVIYPDESRMLTDYDADSNVIRTQDNNGLQRFYTVDALSRTTRVDVDKSGLPAGLEVAGATFERYAYDGLDRQTMAENDFAICTYRYNSLSWPLAETIQFSLNEAPIQTPFAIAREFDDVGMLVELTYPNGRRLRLERDELNRLERVQNVANGNGYPGDPAAPDNRLVARMTYAGRQRDRCLFANDASTAYRHDGAGRVIEIAHTGPNVPLLAIQYLYDAAGNVRVRNDVLPTGPRTERFAYDSFYRLAHESKPDTTETFNLSTFGPAIGSLADPLPDRQSAMTALIGLLELPQVARTYHYDLVGNRDVERAADGSSVDYQINPLDQYTSRNGTSYTYDANGNLKDDEQRRYIYDSLNRLVGVDEAGGSEVACFWHDALGRRILERMGGNITQLICDGDDVIAEYRAGDPFAQYVYDDGIDRPLHIAAENREHWYHSDLVGSVRLLTGATSTLSIAYRYTPFGKLVDVIGNEIFNPWHYTARRFDLALESYDYRARQYAPEFGRFLQRDPGGMVDGTIPYKYTSYNPLVFSDPFGHEKRNERDTMAYPDLAVDEALFQLQYQTSVELKLLNPDYDTLLADKRNEEDVERYRELRGLLWEYQEAASINPKLSEWERKSWGATLYDLGTVRRAMAANLSIYYRKNINNEQQALAALGQKLKEQEKSLKRVLMSISDAKKAEKLAKVILYTNDAAEFALGIAHANHRYDHIVGTAGQEAPLVKHTLSAGFGIEMATNIEKAKFIKKGIKMLGDYTVLLALAHEGVTIKGELVQRISNTLEHASASSRRIYQYSKEMRKASELSDVKERGTRWYDP